MEAPILVTGADGFVGRHLLAALGNTARDAVADVTEPEQLAAAFREAKPRAVVHLAARSSVAESWSRGGEIWHVNAIGTVNVLDAVAGWAPDARVLVVSSGEVYGRLGHPAREDDAVAPLSPYAASKLAAEIACERAVRVECRDVVIARPFAHIGPGQEERFVVGSWTMQLARLEADGGGMLEVGDVTVERDLTDVRDVCRAYHALLDRSTPVGCFNVASGKGVRLQAVLDVLLQLTKAPIEVRADPARFRRADIPSLVGDATALREATGWSPSIPLETTLADALEDARGRVRAERTVAL